MELAGHDADRNAGRAIDAARPVGDALAAAEADPAQRVVEFDGMLSAQLGEHLALRLARQIGAWRRRRHEETGEAERCAHRDSTGFETSMVAEIFMRLWAR